MLDRFGSAVLEPTAFTLEGFRVSAPTSARPAADLFDDFAPGQFAALSDDERLARPAFESLRSGGRVAVARFRVPADRPAGVPAQAGYEESVVDVEPETEVRLDAAPATAAGPLPAAALEALVLAGPAARAEVRTTGSAAFRGPDLGVAVAPERYLVAEADTLAPIAGAVPESSAEAHDRLGRQRRGGRARMVAPAREVV
jgi:hypothetical protein